MKREVRYLLDKACDSLLLSIEFFNRPYERGRISSILILLDHAFEMLLKAAILHRGGRIRERRARETIGFERCVRRALSDGAIKFITEEHALILQTINGLRDAAQHYLIDVSEDQLYVYCQAGVSLYRDIFKSVFNKELGDYLPGRVLPISTSPPTDLTTLFDNEIREILKLLRPKRRRRIDVEARLRTLAILDSRIRGENGQPSSGEMKRVANELLEGRSWQEIFAGVAAINIVPDSSGPVVSLRLTKKEGIPIHLVPEGTPGASVVAIRRVNELDYYSLGRDQLAEHIGLSGPKASAMIWYTKLQDDPTCFKEIRIGKTKFKRYSRQAIERLKKDMSDLSVDHVWEVYKANRGSSARHIGVN